MQEKSWWTWGRGDGSRYAPSGIDALWRRVADRRDWQAARLEFGPLTQLAGEGLSEKAEQIEADRQGDLYDWKVLHYRFKAIAQLWQPSPENPALHCLSEFNLLQHPDAVALRATLEMAAVDGDLPVRLDGWDLRVVPASLRGFLLMTCVADVAAKVRFRRCAHCSEWFRPRRADNAYCSNACRQAHHQATKRAA